MEKYTIEDIEVIRQKSGLSYQEAVALLDYHNGNLARALIDLERNGRLKETESTGSAAARNSGAERGFPGLLNRLLRFRLKISRNNVPIINLSVLFSALVILVAPKLAALSGILALLLGCNFAFDRNDNAFAGDSLQKMVRNAGENAKNSVNNVVRTFSDEFGGSGDRNSSSGKTAEAPAPTVKDSVKEPVKEIKAEVPAEAETGAAAEKAVESYFAGNPAVVHGTAFSASSVPTIQVPVQVEASEGNISVEDQNDGYSTLTID